MENYSCFENLERPFRDTINYIEESLNILEKNKDFIGNLEEKEQEEFELLEEEFKKNLEDLKVLKDFLFQ